MKLLHSFRQRDQDLNYVYRGRNAYRMLINKSYVFRGSMSFYCFNIHGLAPATAKCGKAY